ncbi:protein MIZU-KUSSEI 1 [Punica granatum]|nr:protein MIZU-KUSSEI 1 [Punica granatum]PKI43433.1 hypothetical protein CRG98_036190 [Punica granatum]
MTKISTLCRFALPCFAPSASASSPTTCHPASISTAIAVPSSKNRISTTLRDTLAESIQEPGPRREEDSEVETNSISSPLAPSAAPPRPSKTMVTGTIFGPRRGHVWFCIQHDRLSTKPFLLLELSIPTHQLVKEMQSSELMRIALECSSSAYSCTLRSVPMWTLSCNGKKLGFAVRRKSNDQSRSILKAMQSMTVGAGVIPPSVGAQSSEELMYMRANYEHVVGSADSESFHLISPDQCPGQELSVFLLRSK